MNTVKDTRAPGSKGIALKRVLKKRNGKEGRELLREAASCRRSFYTHGLGE
jgi:hypothetical protein